MPLFHMKIQALRNQHHCLCVFINLTVRLQNAYCLTYKTNYPTLSQMKQLMAIFLLFLPISTYAETALSYKTDIEKCDNAAKQDLNNPENYSNVRMVQITDTQTECYKSVALGIIQKSYAKNAKSMVLEFNNFCDVAQRLSYTTMYPDSCTPQCGTIAGAQAAELYQKMLLGYINSLIEASESTSY